MEQDRESFSAVTIIDGYRRRIIHNDSHHLLRQASNIAHELGHRHSRSYRASCTR
jgi:hypothetical protein